jgi:hypothetical protein
MTDDFEQLERRLRGIDPHPPEVPVERADSPSALALMRRTMDTDFSLEAPPSPSNRERRRVVTVALGAAAAAVLLFGALALFVEDAGDSPAPDDPAAVVQSFALPFSDPASTMCLPVAEAVIPPDALAFAGTVIALRPGGTVEMVVDRWYTAGEADVVRLESGTNVSVALDGVEFAVNEQYLVTVIDGTVAICGVSGPVSPELEQLYEQWYGG